MGIDRYSAGKNPGSRSSERQSRRWGIGGQHGWWQSCPNLGLPGYDPLGPDGANINLVIGDEVLDPVSGAAPHRAYPCQLQKLDENSG